MDKFNLPKSLLDAVSNVVSGSRKEQAEQNTQFKQAMEQRYKPTTLRPLPAESLAEQPKRESKDAALHSSIREVFVKSAVAAQQEQQSAVGRINSMYARTGAARPVTEAKAHTVPKTEKEKSLAALASPKNKITHKDVLVGRGVVKEQGIEHSVEEANNPFDYKNYKSQLPTKPGEKAGFDSKKISTGTVYSRKPVKDESVKEAAVSPTLASIRQRAQNKAKANATAFNAMSQNDKDKAMQMGQRGKKTTGVEESLAAVQHLERAKSASSEGERHAHMIEHHMEMARLHNDLNDKWQSDKHFDLAKKHADQLSKLSKDEKLDENIQAVLEKITVVHGHPPAGQSYDQTKTDGGVTSGIRYMPPSQKPAGAQNKPRFRPTGAVLAGSKSDSPGLQNALARLKSTKARGGLKNEEKDTPGNGYEHQCAIHVKHAKLGEGRTLFSQHAEPAEDGSIAWYDIMFEHGIEKQVPTTDLEIVVSESHMNHKKKK